MRYHITFFHFTGPGGRLPEDGTRIWLLSPDGCINTGTFVTLPVTRRPAVRLERDVPARYDETGEMQSPARSTLLVAEHLRDGHRWAKVRRRDA